MMKECFCLDYFLTLSFADLYWEGIPNIIPTANGLRISLVMKGKGMKLF